MIKCKGDTIMKTNEIFKLSHQSINTNSLIPISLFQENKFRLKIIKKTKYEIPPYQTILEGIKYIDKPIDRFYFNDNFLSPYFYFNGEVAALLEIFAWDIEHLKSFQVKEHIEIMEKRLASLIKAKNYHTLFILIDKRIAFDFYIQSFDDIPDEQKYKYFEDLYVRSEYGFSDLDKDFLLNIFKYAPKEDLSKKIEIDDNGLIRIYRGQNTKSTPYKEAFSWTTNKDTAIFFATRFDKYSGKLYEAIVKSEDILAYIDRRGESEVIVNPDCLIGVKKIKEGR